MKILPITNNTYKSQNPTFNAVNQKYYKWGKDEIVNGKSLTINFLYCLEHDSLLFKDLNPQDAIDTLKALREIIKPQKDEYLNEVIGRCKQQADKQRPQLKKFLKKVSQ